ncbi:DUF4384 domain-containing protein [Candidatus Pelagibacter sp.]|nr:DUF4384 domain-containing protein [Candidatus Pelagibacter sp.]
MSKYILIFFFITASAFAEVVDAEGSYIYGGDMARNEACSLAKERAKLKALEKVLGQTITSEEMEKCSEVDGKTTCERNQFFLSTFNGDVAIIGQPKENIEPAEVSGQKIDICRIKIRAKVTKTTKTLDSSFDFNVKLNEKNFRDGEELKIDIELNKPFYLTIFQILPYEKKDYQVHKLFPNEREQDNFLNGKSLSLPKKGTRYKIEFPNIDNKNSVDEYLVFIASKKDINWLDKYAKTEDLKNAYIRENSLKYLYKEYTIYK